MTALGGTIGRAAERAALAGAIDDAYAGLLTPGQMFQTAYVPASIPEATGVT